MTTSTTNSGDWKLLVFPATLGLVSALALIFGTGLSPFAGADRPALSLFVICLSVPLGAAVARMPRADDPRALRHAGTRAAGALMMGVLLALLTSGPDPELFLRSASWCAAGCLLGAALGGIAHGAGICITLAWLVLCGLPFFCDKLGAWSGAATTYALQGCPWLGFSQDAFAGDPLRRSVIYLGRWSPLADQPAMGLLKAGELWGAAAPSLAAALLRAVAPARPRA